MCYVNDMISIFVGIGVTRYAHSTCRKYSTTFSSVGHENNTLYGGRHWKFALVVEWLNHSAD